MEPNESILDTVCSSVFWNCDYAQLKADFQKLNKQKVLVTKAQLESYMLDEPHSSEGIIIRCNW